MVLIWYSAAERKKQISEEIKGNTLRLSRFLASNLERDLSAGESYLTAVTEVLRGKRRLTDGCAEPLRELMGATSVYRNIGLAARDGRIVCSARAAPFRNPGQFTHFLLP
ncbi:MAG: hypothetical protein M3Y08_10250 [Fibrobacterota bacterium]|nr:hypothetical protein [Fibrobacterota bacterium]